MNGWKLTAIIFIILFVAETIFFVWLVQNGFEEIEKENECAINICEWYDAYQYYDSICYCYEDGEIVYEEYVR